MKLKKSSLKNLLMERLKVKGILSRKEIFKIAEDNGFLQSNAERRLRYENGFERESIQRLNAKKKPCKRSEFVCYFKWVGEKNVWK